MPQVITFEDYVPPARYDGIPWTDARVYEGASSTGPWTLIDTITLTPVDSDPANPAERSFTTELASDTPALWYRIIFVDGTGDVSQPTDPVQNIAGGSSDVGPCLEWVTAADVAAVCESVGTDYSVFDNYALMASQALYELSGRQFSGVCGPVTVRPCVPSCSCWFPGSLAFWYSGGGGWWGNAAYWIAGGGGGVAAVQDCGSGGGCCGSLSRVKLAGYPVQQITEVKINGVAIDASNYRLDGNKWLTYLNDADGNPQRWPGCQNLARADTEEGTFSVSYTHGIDPPLLGQEAAAQLACALASTGAECGLPAGTSKVTRLGIQIEMLSNAKGIPISFASIPLVQLFLQTYNPAGLRRRSAAWSPDIQPYAQKVG